MPMSYVTVQSANIDIFPVSYDRSTHPYARVFTEDHIADIVRCATGDSDQSYVLSGTPSDSPFCFVLKGYLIKLTSTEELLESFSSATDVYANVSVVNRTQQRVIPQIDDGASCVGIKFSSAPLTRTDLELSDADGLYSLLLFSRSVASDPWNVPALSSYTIDGGEI